MKKYKNHVRAANMLLQVLYGLKQERMQLIQQKLKDFIYKSSGITKNSRIFQRAVEKGWYPSAEKIRSRISRNLTDFSDHLLQFKDIINTDSIELPNSGDIVAELLQVEQEFGDLKFDLKAGMLSVMTEPIELEGIYFGLFEIQLNINEIKKLHSESPYKVIALEPNPAGSDDLVTHPHVSHEKLCEGDGYIPIRKAIQQGRLNDFFTIIMKILQTYNPGSPYVALDDWGGTSCYDCGYTVSGDDCYYCEDCERDYCSCCSTYCQVCQATVCKGCSLECPACNKSVCQHCTGICAECEETLCTDCINEEGLCNNCQEQRKEKEHEEEQTTPEAEPAVQSDSLGQTRIPA